MSRRRPRVPGIPSRDEHSVILDLTSYVAPRVVVAAPYYYDPYYYYDPFWYRPSFSLGFSFGGFGYRGGHYGGGFRGGHHGRH